MSGSYNVIGSGELMDIINRALRNKQPLSIVSLGATEAYVMAQYTILSEEEFMNHPQALITNSNKNPKSNRGFKFPNVMLRDEMVEAVKQADIVAYPLSLRTMDSGLMAEKVMGAYGIRPQYVYEALIRRIIMLSQKEKFEEMLRGRKILLIGRTAKEVKTAMKQKLKQKLGFSIVGTINIDSYADVQKAKEQIGQYDFDLCLLSAGVFAVILAPYIAQKYNKVAFDIGQGLSTIASNEIKVSAFVRSIGLDNLMKM